MHSKAMIRARAEERRNRVVGRLCICTCLDPFWVTWALRWLFLTTGAALARSWRPYAYGTGGAGRRRMASEGFDSVANLRQGKRGCQQFQGGVIKSVCEKIWNSREFRISDFGLRN